MTAPARGAVTPSNELNTATLIARNVLRLRKERHMSTSILALRTGWPVSRIAAIEAGDADALALDDIDVLAKAFVVRPAELFA
ncbi:helix-turn-helix domain-containing protein [Devosia sp. BK]|uniref:helix-turn-helix domain-containing protein n=1 Tax=Devosia sp. BK TaxID=2871706 RepID=UPI00293A92E6|nr:helix-turn-helix transcriptional regulator [Devosia sp. BK]MDV3251880.1 helix-turn-helix domain-containing protein [Devosia sp. BK]